MEAENKIHESLTQMLDGVGGNTEEQASVKPDETDTEITEKEPVKPETDTSEKDSQLPEGQEEDEVTRVMREEGLDKRFESPAGVLKKYREQEAYITRLSQERAELMRRGFTPQQQLTPQSQPEPNALEGFDGEKLLENPSAYARALEAHIAKQMGPMVEQRTAQVLNDRDVDTFFNNTPDFADYSNAMQVLFQQNPEIQLLPTAKGLKMLYRLAKAENQPVKPATELSPGAGNVERAVAGGSGLRKLKKGSAVRTQADWDGMSEKELEDKLGFGSG